MTGSQEGGGELRDAVERMHDGTATLAQSVPVRETFEGRTVWEGVVHVFDLTGHLTATRAWSSPIEGAWGGGSSRCCISRLWRVRNPQYG